MCIRAAWPNNSHVQWFGDCSIKFGEFWVNLVILQSSQLTFTSNQAIFMWNQVTPTWNLVISSSKSVMFPINLATPKATLVILASSVTKFFTIARQICWLTWLTVTALSRPDFSSSSRSIVCFFLFFFFKKPPTTTSHLSSNCSIQNKIQLDEKNQVLDAVSTERPAEWEGQGDNRVNDEFSTRRQMNFAFLWLKFKHYWGFSGSFVPPPPSIKIEAVAIMTHRGGESLTPLPKSYLLLIDLSISAFFSGKWTQGNSMAVGEVTFTLRPHLPPSGILGKFSLAHPTCRERNFFLIAPTNCGQYNFAPIIELRRKIWGKIFLHNSFLLLLASSIICQIFSSGLGKHAHMVRARVQRARCGRRARVIYTAEAFHGLSVRGVWERFIRPRNRINTSTMVRRVSGQSIKGSAE